METFLILSLDPNVDRMLMTRLFLLVIIIFFSSCSSTPQVNIPLKYTYWSLTHIKAKEIKNHPSQSEIHLIFHINGDTLHGNDGCNRLISQYLINEGTIVFLGLSSSKMACAAGSSQSHQFTEALEQVDTYKIEQSTMVLFFEKQEILRFEAQENY